MSDEPSQPRRPHTAFGEDAFGQRAERAARFFGTPQYIIGQTAVVVLWILLNSLAVTYHWDPYPFILLNLAFSTQAAYAAPLILLAETRQADRDKAHTEMIEKHHETQNESAARRERELRQGVKELRDLLDSNTELTRQDKELTEQVAALSREIRSLLETAR